MEERHHLDSSDGEHRQHRSQGITHSNLLLLLLKPGLVVLHLAWVAPCRALAFHFLLSNLDLDIMCLLLEQHQ